LKLARVDVLGLAARTRANHDAAPGVSEQAQQALARLTAR